MPIKPFRDYDEHEVLNGYSYLCLGTSLPQTKGVFVKVTGSGIVTTAVSPEMIGSVGNSYTNTVSQRWGVPANVTIAGTGDAYPLGLTLYDVREVDENSEALLYNPRKQDEMQCVLTGQAVPILTRGVVTWSGVTGPPTGGAPAYLAANGLLSTAGPGPRVGQFLGAAGSDGWVFLKVQL